MSQFNYPSHMPQNGYMTASIRQAYINTAIDQKKLPENAQRMANIISLSASNDPSQAIQFWQLYSVVGTHWIIEFVRNFYQRVFADEPWFVSVFQRVGGLEHHVRTQASMWVDVMGGGLAYHGGEYRLNFHHTHNAMALMNEKGAQRWVSLMVDTLNDPSVDYADDPRVKPSLITFLSYFLSKYEAEFNFSNSGEFGEINPDYKRRINLQNMSEADIEALSEAELRDALIARKVDVSNYVNKAELLSKALRM